MRVLHTHAHTHTCTHTHMHTHTHAHTHTCTHTHMNIKNNESTPEILRMSMPLMLIKMSSTCHTTHQTK